MTILKKALLSIIRKPQNSIPITVILFIVFSFCFFGILIQSSARQTEKVTIDYIGAKMMIYCKPSFQNQQNNYLIEQLENIKNFEHVIGINQVIEIFSTPLNFSNSKKHQGKNPASQNANADSDIDINKYAQVVSLIGTERCDLIDTFRREKNVLIEGVFPDSINNGAIISKELAQENNLKIGDKLLLIPDSSAINTEIELLIVGIYMTNMYFDIQDTNFWGEGVFAISPYNQIYTNLDLVSAYTPSYQKDKSISIYVDHPDNLESVAMKIKSLGINWAEYSLLDLTGMEFKAQANQLSSINSKSTYLILISLVLGGLIVFLTISLWAKDTMYETGLLLCLGNSKRRVIFQQNISNIFIGGAAALLALPVSLIASYIFVENMQLDFNSLNDKDTIYSFLSGETIYNINMKLNIDNEIIFNFIIIAILLLLIASFLPSLIILKAKPSDILKNVE